MKPKPFSECRRMHSYRMPATTTEQIEELKQPLGMQSQADVIAECVRIIHVERVKYPTFRNNK